MSNGIFCRSDGCTVTGDSINPMVWPSGADRATVPMPLSIAAPG